MLVLQERLSLTAPSLVLPALGATAAATTLAPALSAPALSPRLAILAPSVSVAAPQAAASPAPALLRTQEALAKSQDLSDRRLALDTLFLGAPQEDGPAASAEESILSDLRSRPPKALAVDYDNTLTERGPDGLSLPPSEDIVRSLTDILAAGTPVILSTSRYFDHQPEAAFELTLFKPLISRIPASLRRLLFVSGGVGSELVAFSDEGEPRRLKLSQWQDSEAQALRRAATEAASAAGLAEGQVQIMVAPGQFVARLPDAEERAGAFAEELSRRLAAAGLPFKVLHNRNFVYFSRSDKGRGLAETLEAMRALGLQVAEPDLLLLGDEFRLPDGGDAAMALAFPQARAVSVGDAGAASLAAGVRRFGVKAGPGSRLILEAVAAGVAAPR